MKLCYLIIYSIVNLFLIKITISITGLSYWHKVLNSRDYKSKLTFLSNIYNNKIYMPFHNNKLDTSISNEYEIENIEVKLDHFNYHDNRSFFIKCLINYKNYKNYDSPTFFYTGNEGNIEDFYNGSGFVTKTLAEKFGALIVFCEHRFYGDSHPFKQKHYNVDPYDIKYNQYLTSEQALADFSSIANILIFKKKLTKKIIAVGGSYGGMLSAWARMKYPNVFIGSIASSAPILLFENPNEKFFNITSNTYLRYDDNSSYSSCVMRLKRGFNKLKELIDSNNLTDKTKEFIKSSFNICQSDIKLNNLKIFLDSLIDSSVFYAQYNYPYDFTMTEGVYIGGNPAKTICENTSNIDIKQSNEYSDILYLTALSDKFNKDFNLNCIDIEDKLDENPNLWMYQACTEMIMPIYSDGKNDMYIKNIWNLKDYINKCVYIWNGDVRPYYIFDTFGGRNFKQEIKNYSNIIFVNGLMDPWYSGCPSKEYFDKEDFKRYVRVYEADSAHHLDLRLPNENDPSSMKQIRKELISIISDWIK